ncbi:hypothetical protein ACIG3E_11260 [Streptomyces sp. NPDC053474]|uniref:hypothetical protein n=1 Tax=Streptomyces sp. NPDC053474 TaxID=3365704 RepID=UPI0037D706F2
MPTVVDMTRAEVEQWRSGLLAQTRLSYEELSARAELYQLSADEMDIWSTIQGLDYLLADDE